jgi:hypothetical protein
VLPLGLAVAALIAGKIYQNSYRAADLNLIGLVSAVVAVPLFLPSILSAIGFLLARSRFVHISIAGRRMQWDPVRVARPFLGTATLLTLTLVATGYVALASHMEAPPRASGSTQAVTIEWQDPKPDDLDRLASVMTDTALVPFSEEHMHQEASEGHDHYGDGPNQPPEETLLVGATCAELSRIYSEPGCSAGDSDEIPVRIRDHLQLSLSPASHGPVHNIRLVPRGEVVGASRAIAIGAGPISALDAKARDAAMGFLPAPYVRSSMSSEGRESPLVPWIIYGGVVAAIILALACSLALVDSSLADRLDLKRLFYLGISTRSLLALLFWLFVAPYTVACAVGFSAGFTVCSMLVGTAGVAMPWSVIGSILATMMLVGALGVVGSVIFGRRVILQRGLLS